MNKDDAIKLAMEYGFTGGFDADGNLMHDSEFVEAVLEAVAAEREACAKVCDSMPYRAASAGKAADLIRARSQE